MQPHRRAYDAAAERRRLVQLLHVAKNDLSMEDADYRAVLSAASKGVHDSSTKLSLTELERALAHMKRCGFKVRTKGKTSPARATPPRPLAVDPESTKIRALWLMLHDLGAVKNPAEAALNAYVKRLTHVDDLHWVDGAQAETLIESLKKWALRYLPAAIKQLVDQAASMPLTDAQRTRINGLLSLASSRGTFDPMRSAWEALADAVKPAGGRQ